MDIISDLLSGVHAASLVRNAAPPRRGLNEVAGRQRKMPSTVEVDDPQVRRPGILHNVSKTACIDDALAVWRDLRFERVLELEDVGSASRLVVVPAKASTLEREETTSSVRKLARQKEKGHPQVAITKKKATLASGLRY